MKHVLSEFARSEAVGMTRDVVCELDYFPVHHFLWECSEVKVKVVKNMNSKVQIPVKTA